MSKISVSKINLPFQSIILAGENSPLISELVVQIKQHNNFSVLNHVGKFSQYQSQLNVSAIIYFIGFGPSSLNQTLLSTETLHNYLQLAAANNCQLILIAGNTSLPSSKTALILANQFVKVKKIILSVVQFSPEISFSEQAESVIAKIIYKHKKVALAAVPVNKTLKTPSPQKLSAFRPKKSKKPIFAAAVGALLGLLVSIHFISQSQLNCGLKEYSDSNFGPAQKCLSIFEQIEKFNPLGRLTMFKPKINSSEVDLLRQLIRNNQQLTASLFNISAKNDLLSESTVIAGKLASVNSSLFAQKMKTEKTIYEKLQLLLPQLHRLVNTTQSVTLLFIFHDTHSPSPVGGRISSISLLTITKEGIVESKAYTGHSLDLLFPGQLTSSELFEIFSGSDTMTLGDLAFEPDPSRVMSAAANYVEKSLSRKINFVVSANDSFRSQLFPLLKPGADLNLLLFKSIHLLEKKEIYLSSHNPPIPELDLIEWSGKLQLADCNSWLPCLHQMVFPSFFLLEPSQLDRELSASSLLSNQISSTGITSRLDINLNRPSAVQTKVVFWLATSHQTQVNQVSFNGAVLNPLIEKNSYSPGINLQGYQLLIGQNENNALRVDYFQPLPAGLTRFRYQLDYPDYRSSSGDLTATFHYPPSWPVISYFTPSVASPGQLSYNVPLASYRIILEYVQK